MEPRLPFLRVLLLLSHLCIPLGGSADSVAESFRNPPRQYSPVPIWWWSGGKVEKERLEWQLERMAEGHIWNTIILNLYPVSDQPRAYSPEWWQLMDSAIKKAEKLGIGIWFYDSLGFAPTTIYQDVLKAEPDYRAEMLVCVHKDGDQGEAIELRLPKGARYVSAFLARIGNGASLDDISPIPGPLPNDTLRTTLPAGRSRVMLFYTHPADLDFSNPQAAGKLIDGVHGEFERRYSHYLGNVIPGSFQDEMLPMPRWSRGLRQEFSKQKGYDLGSHLPALFFNCGPMTARYRYDYRDVLGAMCEEAFFKPCFNWHEKHGMICGMDQLARNGDPVSAQAKYIDYFRVMRWYGAPGQDQAGNAKANSSIAHLYGRPRSWMEGFYNAGWGQTVEELAGRVNTWYAQGANLLNPHAWYYSTAGSWWEWAPPCTSFRQPYWRHYKYFADYVSRMSYLLSQGVHVCDIAVLYPSTSITADMSLDGRVSAAARATQTAFWATVKTLDADRRDYDWMDEASLQRAVIQNGRIQVGSEEYRVLIVPRTLLVQPQSGAKIQQFIADGGTVILAGDGPQILGKNGAESITLTGATVHRMADPKALPTILEPILPRDHPPGIQCLHRKIDDRHFYFVVPGGSKSKRISFRARGRPLIWDPYTGEVHPVADYRITDAGTDMTLDFDLSPSFFVVIRPSEKEDRREKRSPANIREIALDGDWDFELQPTLDNRWGDFELPATNGFLPIDAREFRYAEESSNDGVNAAWHRPEFVDSHWARTVYSHGTYWMASGPHKIDDAADTEKPFAHQTATVDWRPVVFSRRFGIEKDPIHKTTLGAKSIVPDEFVDLGVIANRSIYYLTTQAFSPADQEASLRLSCPSRKTIWLNDQLVADETRGAPAGSSHRVNLKRGWNRISIKLRCEAGSRPRVAFALASPSAAEVTSSQWIWTAQSDINSVWFRKTIDLPAQPEKAYVCITANNGYELSVNGRPVGFELGFDVVHRRRAETYALPLQKGRNTITVRATNFAGKGGLLMWGRVNLPSGELLSIGTDKSWEASTHDDRNWSDRVAKGKWEPARVFGPKGSAPWGVIRGETLLEEPTAGPSMPDYDLPGIIYDPNPERTPAAWYRFKLPPGTQAFHLSLTTPHRIYVDGLLQAAGPDGWVRLADPLPSGGVCAVRAAQQPGRRAGAVFAEPVRFVCGKGRISPGSWHEKGLPHYSGIGIYSRQFELPAADAGKPLVLDLGNVRGTAEVLINGEPAGVRLWRPYRFELTKLVHPGRNDLRIIVANTLGPHYKTGTPSSYVLPGQEVSGIIGPATLRIERDSAVD